MPRTIFTHVVRGVILEVMELKQGTNWRRRDFMLSTSLSYQQQILISAYDSLADKIPPVGTRVKVRFTIRTTESKGKHFTNLRLYGLEELSE